MKRIAVTGLNGVIGKIFTKELPRNFEIIDLYNKTRSNSSKIKKHVHLDLLDKANISKKLEEIKPEVILHMAAITHIDNCEKDKKNGKKGKVWRVNVDASGEIAKFCAKNNTHLIFLSTECVFDGKKKKYSETARKSPINWYGFTKSKAEEKIIKSGARFAIVRAVVAYHKQDENKTIYGKILHALKAKKEVYGATDRFFTPTYTPDIVKAILIVIEKKLTGILHVAPEKVLTPFDFSLLIAKKNSFKSSRVKKTKLENVYGKQRSSIRLVNASLDGRKTNKVLGFTPLSPEKVI